MTLPVSGSISLSDVLTELKIANAARGAPISLGDADVIALAGKGAVPVSISDLYGKSSYIPMVLTGNNDSNGTFTTGQSGTVSCTPSVSVANGRGTKSYLWSFISNPNNCTLGNATSSACIVSHAYGIGSNGAAHAVLQCVVNDDIASATATGITADLDWTP